MAKSNKHRRCTTPGCFNIISKKDRKKRAICTECKRRLEQDEQYSKEELSAKVVRDEELAERLGIKT